MKVTWDSSSRKSPEWTARYIWHWKRNTSNLLGLESSNVSGMQGLIKVLDFCDGIPLILLARSCKTCAGFISRSGGSIGSGSSSGLESGLSSFWIGSLAGALNKKSGAGVHAGDGECWTPEGPVAEGEALGWHLAVAIRASPMPVLCELHVDLPGLMCEMNESLNILLQMCFGSGWVMRNRMEECQKQVRMWTRTWPQLLSCALVAHDILIWNTRSNREKRWKLKLMFRLKLQIDTSTYIY